MKILIIEDEQPAALALKETVQQLNGQYEVIDMLASNAELVAWAKANAWPDLILSDIELLDGPVFKSLQTLRPTSPIIFTTAYDHYMAEAFETNGISYLLKPFGEADLKAALNKLALFKTPTDSEMLDKLIRQMDHIRHEETFKKRFTIRKGSGMYLLDVEEITSMSMINGVLHVFDMKGSNHLLSQNLNEFFAQLNPNTFYLINRSEGIAWQYIEKLESYGKERLAVYVKGREQALISSASKTPRLRKWLEG